MFTRKLLTAGLIASVLILGTAIAGEPELKSSGQQISSDSSLAAKVKAALIENETTKAYQINVEASDGQVQLNGFVDSAQERMVAGQVAGQVAGTDRVKNNLEVKAGERTAGEAIDDGMITAKVKAKLIGDSRTKAHQIDVTTREGIVQLGGFVDDATAKAAAMELAETVDGVKSVDNKLSIRN